VFDYYLLRTCFVYAAVSTKDGRRRYEGNNKQGTRFQGTRSKGSRDKVQGTRDKVQDTRYKVQGNKAQGNKIQGTGCDAIPDMALQVVLYKSR
ncbi:MAG: hypothetical protein KGL19_00405, partial [Bacteroidota bacterium]|nr:hypothetical protein [Bacteroidota bacterium]